MTRTIENSPIKTKFQQRAPYFSDIEENLASFIIVGYLDFYFLIKYLYIHR
jgi:hypothetical protein